MNINETVLQKHREHEEVKAVIRVRELMRRMEAPADDFDYWAKVFKESISINQGDKSRNGKFLETMVRELLVEHAIPFQAQVPIDSAERVMPSGTAFKSCRNLIDFVVGDVHEGVSIGDLAVVSCKTTCRERWQQDGHIHAKQFYLVTLASDFPSSEDFNESATRKIVSSMTKRTDNRAYKCTFDTLIHELKEFCAPPKQSEALEQPEV